MLCRCEWRSVAVLVTSSDAAAAVHILPSRRLAASLSSFKWSAWRIGAAADIWGLAELLNSPANSYNEFLSVLSTSATSLRSWSAYVCLSWWHWKTDTLLIALLTWMYMNVCSKDEWVIDMHMYSNGFFLINYLQMVLFHFKRGKGNFKVPYDVI